ncbi:MAG: serine/threonine protein kinase [Microcoleus vaginatus WJT46-NPBG5]|nr:serine/threonine protein kinase [Microcoleus vaginatus WJT46-NPBG5]
MTFCLNPSCSHPKNPESVSHCQKCGSALLLRNRYRALTPIGQGGFGITYLAVDEDRLGTRCVIKQFVPKIEGSGSRQQASLEKAIQLFNQEALRLCELGEHRQIPTLLAFFEQDKRLYLVQEFIDGQNLWQELEEQGAFSEQQVRQVLAQMLPVLKFIHGHRVIHRDITPANVLRRHRDGQLMLIDFGVAKLLSRTSMAQTGTKIGTHGYAPLEQMRSGKAYPASDIYSLGVTCLHLLTKVKPEHLYDPLTGWTWREHLFNQGKAISDQLGQILDRMVQEMVRERYQSADEVINELNELPASSLPSPTIAPLPSAKPAMGSASGKKSDESSIHATVNAPAAVSKPRSRGWRCVQTLQGHSSWVTSIAIGPNSHILASGSLDDTIKIWNLHTGELLRTLFGHLNAVNSVAISRDGQIVASCSDDGNIKLWEISTGHLLSTLVGHLRDINSVAISSDGQTLASGSEDRTVKLWQLVHAVEQQQSYPWRNLSGRSGMIKSVAISPDGHFVASGGLDNNIHIWNLANGEVFNTLSGHFNSVNSVAISPDGKILASGSKDQTIKLWPMAAGATTPLRTLSGHAGMVNSVIFSPQGSTLITGSSDKTIKLWHVATGKLLGTLSGHLGAVNAVAISSDGKTIISGSWDKTIKIWRWFP